MNEHPDTATHAEPDSTTDERAPEAVADAAASRLVARCEEAWRAIQSRHPQVPETVIVLGTGVERGRLVKLGHWWGGQWRVGAEARGEVLLAGEALHLPPEAVFEVLLHEAAHGLSAARGIRDTSRGGRYHNNRFKAAAAEVGLRPRRMDPYGWARTELKPATAEQYAEVIAAIGMEMRMARGLPAQRGVGIEGGTGIGAGKSDGEGDGQRGNGRPKQRAAECECEPPRKMRMAPSVLARGPVVCGICANTFVVDRAAERAAGAEITEAAAALEVVDESFLSRRQRELSTEGPPRDLAAEGRAHLDRIEQVLIAVAPRLEEGQRILQVFRDTKADIARWFEDAVSADVVALPARGAPGVPDEVEGIGIDLRTVELALPAGASKAQPPAAVEVEPPVPELHP